MDKQVLVQLQKHALEMDIEHKKKMYELDLQLRKKEVLLREKELEIREKELQLLDIKIKKESQ